MASFLKMRIAGQCWHQAIGANVAPGVVSNNISNVKHICHEL